jgi:hypothetical protein
MIIGIDPATKQLNWPKGSPYLLKLKFSDGAGFADLTGRVLRFAAFQRTGAVVFDEAFRIAGDTATILFPGSVSEVPAFNGARWQVAQVFEEGPTPLFRGSIDVTPAASDQGPGAGAPASDLLTWAPATQTLLISSIGAPGPSLSEELGMTPQELIAEYVTGPVDEKLAEVDVAVVAKVGQVDDAITELGETTSGKFAEVDDAISRADTATASFEGKVFGLVSVQSDQPFSDVEKAQARSNVGLSEADNTSDADKAASGPIANAINGARSDATAATAALAMLTANGLGEKADAAQTATQIQAEMTARQGVVHQVYGQARYNIISPYTWKNAGASDTVAWQEAIKEAVKSNRSIDHGCGKFFITEPIGTLINRPISLVGDGYGQAQFILDRMMEGDFLSFSNNWYGAEQLIDATGATVTGNPTVCRRRPSGTARRSGVALENLTVTGDRSTPMVQNGIIFYDRNDSVHLSNVEVELIRGVGLGLSGFPSNPAANGSSLMRESHIIDCQARWCGDAPTARPAVVMNSTSKRANQSGYEFDDGNNYNIVRNLKIVFPEGKGFEGNDASINSNHQSNNDIQLIIDSQVSGGANPNVMAGGRLPAANGSIANGIMTLTPGGSFVRVAGVGTGSLSVGTYITHPLVPPGTYIAAINSGPAADGAGTYTISNRTIDISQVAVSTSSGTSWIFGTPFAEFGGGHGGERWDITLNGSATIDTNSIGALFTQSTITDTPKTSQSKLRCSIGKLDIGLLFSSVSTLDVEYLLRGASVDIAVTNITTGVTVDAGHAGTLNELFITGSMQNLHVRPGEQEVVAGNGAIGDVMNASRWPNCPMVFNKNGVLSRYVSIPTSPSFNSCTWVSA